MKLKGKVFCHILAPLVVGSIIALLVVALQTASDIPAWTATPIEGMVAIEEWNLERLLAEKARFTETFFSRVSTEVRTLCSVTRDALEGRIPAGDTPAYSVFSMIGGDVPGFDPVTRTSMDVSGWWQCGSNESVPQPRCRGLEREADLAPSTLARLQATNSLDVWFRNVLASEFPRVPDAFWLVAFEDDGFERSFPNADLFVATSNWTGSCLAPEYVARFGTAEKQGYDSRCRAWYVGAKARPDGQPYFTDPYAFLGSTPGLGITASAAFRTSNTAPGAIEGVCAMDVALSEVALAVEDSFLGRGYGYLLGPEGRVVLHPGLSWKEDPVAPFLEALEVPSGASDDEVAAFVEDVRDPMSGNATGTTRFTKASEEWLVSWRAIAGTGYTLALTVPTTSVTVVREEMRRAIDVMTVTLTVTIAGLVLLVGIAGAFLGWHLTDGIVRPMVQLARLAHQIDIHDFSVDSASLTPSSEPQSAAQRAHNARSATNEVAEVASLVRAITGLYDAMQAANSLVDAGDLDAAKASFHFALAAFVRMGHRQGAGVCHNNLGSLYFRLGDLDSAISHYRVALAIAEEASAAFLREEEVRTSDSFSEADPDVDSATTADSIGRDRSFSDDFGGASDNRIPSFIHSESHQRRRLSPPMRALSASIQGAASFVWEDDDAPSYSMEAATFSVQRRRGLLQQRSYDLMEQEARRRMSLVSALLLRGCRDSRDLKQATDHLAKLDATFLFLAQHPIHAVAFASIMARVLPRSSDSASAPSTPTTSDIVASFPRTTMDSFFAIQHGSQQQQQQQRQLIQRRGVDAPTILSARSLVLLRRLAHVRTLLAITLIRTSPPALGSARATLEEATLVWEEYLRQLNTHTPTTRALVIGFATRDTDPTAAAQHEPEAAAPTSAGTSGPGPLFAGRVAPAPTEGASHTSPPLSSPPTAESVPPLPATSAAAAAALTPTRGAADAAAAAPVGGASLPPAAGHVPPLLRMIQHVHNDHAQSQVAVVRIQVVQSVPGPRAVEDAGARAVDPAAIMWLHARAEREGWNSDLVDVACTSPLNYIEAEPLDVLDLRLGLAEGMLLHALGENAKALQWTLSLLRRVEVADPLCFAHARKLLKDTVSGLGLPGAAAALTDGDGGVCDEQPGLAPILGVKMELL